MAAPPSARPSAASSSSCRHGSASWSGVRARCSWGSIASARARERAEQLLAGMRSGHRQLGGLLGDLRGIVERLAAGLDSEQRGRRADAPVAPLAPLERSLAPLEPPPAPPAPAPPAAAPAPAQAPPAAAVAPAAQPSAAAEARGVEMADALAAAVERLRARAEAVPEAEQPVHVPPPAPAAQATHKHSMSLIKRVRIWRKQRRGR